MSPKRKTTLRPSVAETGSAPSGAYIKRRLVLVVARWLYDDGRAVVGRLGDDCGGRRVAAVVAEAVVDQALVDVVAVALII